MKLRIIALTDEGVNVLKKFYEDTNNKDLIKSELKKFHSDSGISKGKLLIAKGIGVPKSKIYSNNPFSLTVSFSIWNKIPKHLMNTSQVEPLLKEHWFPSLEFNKDYKVKIV